MKAPRYIVKDPITLFLQEKFETLVSFASFLSNFKGIRETH